MLPQMDESAGDWMEGFTPSTLRSVLSRSKRPRYFASIDSYRSKGRYGVLEGDGRIDRSGMSTGHVNQRFVPDKARCPREKKGNANQLASKAVETERN
jgi:hypothetical protein